MFIVLIVSIFAFLVMQMLPGDLKGLSFTMHEVVEQIYLTDEGIFSMPLGVSATLVASFLIFGGFLEKCGTGPFFMDVAQAFTGTAPGGPANIAVMSSCLFGSISGSAVANVYGTVSYASEYTIGSTWSEEIAERFGATPILGGMLGMMTTLGNIDNIAKVIGLYNEAQPLNAILRAGRGGVLAVVIGVWFLAKIEKAGTRIRQVTPETRIIPTKMAKNTSEVPKSF